MYDTVNVAYIAAQCPSLSAQSAADWITVASVRQADTEAPFGAVSFSVAPNNTANLRVGIINIDNLPFTVSQGTTIVPDFVLSIDSATQNVSAGTVAPQFVTINRLGGFNDTVTVTPPAPTPDIVPKFPDPVVTNGSRAKFKLKIRGSAAPGPHQLVFTGTDTSGRTRTATLTLVVQ